jgi:TnpA family transposase
MSQSDNRLKILDDDEIEALYTYILFTDEERLTYFALSETERTLITHLPIKTRVYFILQLGYFKAQKQFFAFRLDEMTDDLIYIHETHYPNFEIEAYGVRAKTRLSQQRIILNLCRYRPCEELERKMLEGKAAQLAKVSSKPIYLFRELLQYLEENKIVMPPYTYLQDAIGKVLQQEQRRLIQFMKSRLNEANVKTFNSLLDNPQGLYEITLLKRSPKDFGSREMKREIRRGEQIQPFYQLGKQLIPQLEISNEGVKYYASLVTYYSAFRLKNLDKHLVYLYLLCFTFHRYQQFQDNLINYLIYQVGHYLQNAKEDAEIRIAQYRLDYHRHLSQAGRVLGLFVDDSISPDTPFKQVQSRAFTLLDRPKLNQVIQQIIHDAMLDERELRWQYIENKAMEFKGRLRTVLQNNALTSALPNDPLLKAVDFLCRAYEAKKALWHYPLEKIPTAFIPETMHRYLYTKDAEGKKQLLHNRYEFLVFRLLRNGLEAGNIFCRESIRFRRLEDDLLTDEQWQRKDVLIAASSLSILKQPIETHLQSLETEFEASLVTVNDRIANGENDYVTIKEQNEKRRWSLSYGNPKVPVNHPFFDLLSLTNIQTVLHFVHRHTQFGSAFEHILHRNAGREADFETLVACLVAWGTNLGLGRMSEISDLTYSTLTNTSLNFIRLETLTAANDIIVNALAELPIFSLYHINDTIHSSSDGQKFETRLHTLNARHSPKYFGLQKGVVSYTLVANHIPVNARIIGANEHESHFVFDLLYNNQTNIQPTIHSTDTHGTNQVNFALLNMFGYQFAPRYKDIYDKVRTSLYGFKHPKKYGDDMLLKPIRKIRNPLIVSEWSNMQRIFLSLALKTTTQHIVVGKLSAYARQNRTKRALWEYDNIFNSLYLLRFVDSLTLRRNVVHALNRGEGYHQLRRAISHANFGKLRFKTEQDQHIWNECSRLLANAVIYYNASILSAFLAGREKLGDTNIKEQLSRISPVAWQHINFHGRYEFNTKAEPIDLQALIEELGNKPLPFLDSN